jgi:hypothetical protein
VPATESKQEEEWRLQKAFDSARPKLREESALIYLQQQHYEIAAMRPLRIAQLRT